MRGTKTFLCLLVLVSVLSACAKGAQPTEVETTPIDTNIKDDPIMDFETTPINANINSDITKEYSESSLQEICKFDGDIHAYQEAYPIECLRNSPGGYRVAYSGKSRIALIWFDAEGQKTFAQLIERKHSVSDYMEIELGDDLKTVYTMYPEGEYLFLYMGRNDVPRTSIHFTEDGYIVYISYGSNNEVEEITTELI